MRALLLLCVLSLPAQAESLREKLLSIPQTDALGGATTRPVATKEAFTFVAGNASPANRAQFTFGNQMFTVDWKPTPGVQPVTDGLGPLFNRESCFACHDNNGRGRAPDGPGQTMDSMLMRLSVPGRDGHGGPKPVPGYGDQLQDRAIAGVPPEGRADVSWSDVPGAYADGERFVLRKPTYAFSQLAYGPLPRDVMASPRVANPVIGLGLLESVPVATLQALADPDDNDGDGISGRLNTVWDAPSQSMKPGRFGWKANVASLLHQNAGAARGDMGINTPVFPNDHCEPEQQACIIEAKKSDQGLEMSEAFFTRLDIYMQLLAVPQQRNAQLPEVVRGATVFRDMGCAGCHLPTLQTDGAVALPELQNQTFHPFTDLLVHDMGEDLSDGRADFDAAPREWRTAPLWGMGLTQKVSGHTMLLHDGRARSVPEAILWHGGEAEAARERFRTAPKTTRDDLLAFLDSL
jgi:CxxC motif-containing protein (DUF1111 family)